MELPWTDSDPRGSLSVAIQDGGYGQRTAIVNRG